MKLFMVGVDYLGQSRMLMLAAEVRLYTPNGDANQLI